MPDLFPPVYIFLRKNFLPSMSRHGTPGCLCLAHPSIWIYGDTFFTAAFQKNVWTVPSTIPSIFYLTTTTAIWTTKLSVLLRKMEFTCLLSLHIVPTDFNYWISPSSALLNQLWETVSNTCSMLILARISIHEVAELTLNSYFSSFTPENIISGFKNSGISLFNRHIFPASLYLPSFVTYQQIGKT